MAGGGRGSGGVGRQQDPDGGFDDGPTHVVVVPSPPGGLGRKGRPRPQSARVDWFGYCSRSSAAQLHEANRLLAAEVARLRAEAASLQSSVQVQEAAAVEQRDRTAEAVRAAKREAHRFDTVLFKLKEEQRACASAQQRVSALEHEVGSLRQAAGAHEEAQKGCEQALNRANEANAKLEELLKEKDSQLTAERALKERDGESARALELRASELKERLAISEAGRESLETLLSRSKEAESIQRRLTDDACERLHAAQVLNKNYEIEVATLRTRQVSLEGVVRSLSERSSKLTQSLRAAEGKEVKASEVERQALQEQLRAEAAEAEAAKLRGELQRVASELRRALDADAAARDMSNESKQLAEDAQAQLAQATRKHKAALKAERERYSAADAELTEAKEEVIGLRDKLLRSEAKVQELSSTSGSYRSEVESLQKRLLQAEATLKQSQEELHKCRRRAEDAEETARRTEEQFQILASEKRLADKADSERAKALELAVNANDRKTRAEAEMISLQDQLAETQNEMARLRALLASERMKHLGEMEKKSALVAETLAALQRQLEKVNARFEDSQRELEKALQQESMLSADNHSLKHKLNSLREENQSMLVMYDKWLKTLTARESPVSLDGIGHAQSAEFLVRQQLAHLERPHSG
eukprot:jgi/Chlat1/162/Chrsp1S03244